MIWSPHPCSRGLRCDSRTEWRGLGPWMSKGSGSISESPLGRSATRLHCPEKSASSPRHYRNYHNTKATSRDIQGLRTHRENGQLHVPAKRRAVCEYQLHVVLRRTMHDSVCRSRLTHHCSSARPIRVNFHETIDFRLQPERWLGNILQKDNREAIQGRHVSPLFTHNKTPLL